MSRFSSSFFPCLRNVSLLLLLLFVDSLENNIVVVVVIMTIIVFCSLLNLKKCFNHLNFRERRRGEKKDR